jgi:hypothetical protein
MPQYGDRQRLAEEVKEIVPKSELLLSWRCSTADRYLIRARLNINGKRD